MQHSHDSSTDSTTRAGHRSLQRRERIGSLRDDIGSLAERIVTAAQGSMITVWVDDEYQIFGARPESVPQVPVHWIVGTYACGAPLSDIAADLDAEHSERRRAFCID